MKIFRSLILFAFTLLVSLPVFAGGVSNDGFMINNTDHLITLTKMAESGKIHFKLATFNEQTNTWEYSNEVTANYLTVSPGQAGVFKVTSTAAISSGSIQVYSEENRSRTCDLEFDYTDGGFGWQTDWIDNKKLVHTYLPTTAIKSSNWYAQIYNTNVAFPTYTSYPYYN